MSNVEILFLPTNLKKDHFVEAVAMRGKKNDTYFNALQHIRYQCRENGIDAALGHGKSRLDALLFCDRKGVGQQIAAQAGK